MAETVHHKVMFKALTHSIVTSLLFFPDEDFIELPKNLGLVSETVEYLTDDGVKLHNWFLPAEGAKACLLFLHGNAGNISGRLPKAAGWVKRGVSVFLLDYRGYGKSEGKIDNEVDLYLDGVAALKWLKEKKGIPLSQIILYGESLGSSLATELATREKFKGLILEAPFTNLLELARHHYSWLPSFLLRDFPFNNLEKIAKIHSPFFLIHGTEDEVCPYEMGQKILAQAPEPKRLFTVPSGAHNDLRDRAGEPYFDRPYEFLMG